MASSVSRGVGGGSEVAAVRFGEERREPRRERRPAAGTPAEEVLVLRECNSSS